MDKFLGILPRRKRHRPGVLATFYRMEGGGVGCEISDDMDPSEIAALMTAISDHCKAMGWNPGRIVNHLSEIEMKRQHPGAARIA